MRILSVLRYAASGAALMGVAALAVSAMPQPAQSQSNLVQNGEVGFVISFIDYALSNNASETGACPNGLTLGGNRLREAIQNGEVPAPPAGSQAAQLAQFGGGGLGGARAAGAAGAQGQRPAAGAPAAGAQQPAAGAQAPAAGGQQQAAAGSAQRQGGVGRMSGPSPCANPDQFGEDPYWRTVEQQRNVPVQGIDLDGQNATANGRAAAGTCAHTDFRGFNGERGIDNQFFRAVGCTPSFQPNGMSVGWNTEMLTGAWGIVIRLRGVDDLRNDNDVEVLVAANADPIQLSPNREPIPGATYATWQDERFRAVTRGRIVNGVLTTEPMNFRWWKITNSIWMERPLDDMRLRVTISPDGQLQGFMAGYTPVEDLYNFQFGFRNGTTGPGGGPSPGAGGSALGASFTVGYSCNGAWNALWAAADGHRDPATGRCSAISTQYQIRAIPAFVVDTPTSSTNADLEAARRQ